MDKAYTYQDVYLVPKYSDLSSRSEADVSIEFCGRKFKLPVVPANMAAVINENIAHFLSENGYFYIMHRFGDTRKFLQRCRQEAWKLVSISVGVKKTDEELIEDIAQSKCRVDFICIDIAHGHSYLMKNMIEFIKAKLPDSIIIAGNVTTGNGVYDLSQWGADAVKCSIGTGGACSTKDMTGFHVPSFTSLQMCAQHGQLFEVPLIADGGIKTDGDIAKAFVATRYEKNLVVMMGSSFAACIDAPGESIYKFDADKSVSNFISDNATELRGLQLRGQIIGKRYYGSASAENKSRTNQPIQNIEGFSVELPCNGMTYEKKLKNIEQNLQSAVSYAGGRYLGTSRGEFRNN